MARRLPIGTCANVLLFAERENNDPCWVEQILVQDPHVKAAIVFGCERLHSGVIVTPSEKVQDVESFRDAIWYFFESSVG
jgi:hypothetical protein